MCILLSSHRAALQLSQREEITMELFRTTSTGSKALDVDAVRGMLPSNGEEVSESELKGRIAEQLPHPFDQYQERRIPPSGMEVDAILTAAVNAGAVIRRYVGPGYSDYVV